MKFTLERHSYAPELNRAHLKSGSIPVPGALSIREVRSRFARAKPGLLAEVRSVYPPEWAHLNRVYAGRVDTRNKALEFKRHLAQRLKGRPLLDGRTLPDPTIQVKTWLVG